MIEKFISDPCHYFSSPRLSWDAMLKMTGIKLEKIHNIDMRLFLEKGMRGGTSYISKRYSKSDQNNTILFLKDTVNLIKITPLCIGIQIIYMDGP